MRKPNEEQQVRKLAAQIRDQETLDRVLDRCATPALRAGVYQKIWPYLGFAPTNPPVTAATASVFGDDLPDGADEEDQPE